MLFVVKHRDKPAKTGIRYIELPAVR